MNINWDYINANAYQKFDCQWLSAVQRHENKVSDRQHQKRLDKQKRIYQTLVKFRQVIESNDPPKTKEEAVKALSPFLAYLFWSIFRTLAVKVIEWAWDQYAEQHKMSGASK